MIILKWSTRTTTRYCTKPRYFHHIVRMYVWRPFLQYTQKPKVHTTFQDDESTGTRSWSKNLCVTKKLNKFLSSREGRTKQWNLVQNSNPLSMKPQFQYCFVCGMKKKMESQERTARFILCSQSTSDSMTKTSDCQSSWTHGGVVERETNPTTFVDTEIIECQSLGAVVVLSRVINIVR
jgi:hypothetical protein